MASASTFFQYKVVQLFLFLCDCEDMVLDYFDAVDWAAGRVIWPVKISAPTIPKSLFSGTRPNLGVIAEKWAG